ncbi:Spy/CpxP family protein refolding chaperone [Bradyrhizobium sp. CCBAU 051011]|uniref:Spy/CpxP family protein refolding chaperone n=1 Tax=Bradyrhizobium sp. CCBAU 051011 TaxID=858422 RepID=UPI001FEDBDEB|nr:Spy/CpxP family protein refolding chaperone [Bradyrhizobium sp. CCBAU 051011]
MGNFHRATHKSELDESERQDFPDTPPWFILTAGMPCLIRVTHLDAESLDRLFAALLIHLNRTSIEPRNKRIPSFVRVITRTATIQVSTHRLETMEDHAVLKFHQLAAVASVSLAIAMFPGGANAQPNRPGEHGWGQGMVGPGMMMGPGMMGRGKFGGMCSPAAAGFSGWRIDRLEQLIKPTDAQRAKFDELKTASNKASEALRLSCPTEVPTTAVGRMEFMEKRMDAMLQSIKTMRPAFEAFYAALSDEQKSRLDSPSGWGRFWRNLW